MPLKPSTPPSTLPGIEVEQQITTAHQQDTRADFTLPKLQPSSGRDCSRQHGMKLASMDESDDFSSQVHSCKPADVPKPDNSKIPHKKPRIVSGIRKTQIPHATSKLASISETDDLSVQANSLIQSEDFVPDDSKVPHKRPRILSGIRRPQRNSAKMMNQMGSICETDDLITDEYFTPSELEQDSSQGIGINSEPSTENLTSHTVAIRGRSQLSTVFEVDEAAHEENAMPVLGSISTKTSKRKGRLLPGRPQRSPPSIRPEVVEDNKSLTLPILEPDSSRVADLRARVLSNGVRQPTERAPTASVHGKKTDITLPILEPDRNRVADTRARVLSNGVRQPMPQSNEKPKRIPSSFYGRRLYRYTTIGTEIHLEEIAQEENINLPILEPDRNRVADLRPRVLSNGVREPTGRAPTASVHGRKNANVTLPKLEPDSRARVLSNGIKQPIERAPTASLNGRKTDFALPKLEPDSSKMPSKKARILSGQPARQTTAKHRLQALPQLTTAERKKSGKKLTAHLTYERLPQLPKRNK